MFNRNNIKSIILKFIQIVVFSIAYSNPYYNNEIIVTFNSIGKQILCRGGSFHPLIYEIKENNITESINIYDENKIIFDSPYIYYFSTKENEKILI